MKHIDMSFEAISRRIRLAGELRDLSVALSKAKAITPERALEIKERRKKERASSQK